ncbi:MAG: potassium-transporting ATPase subunit KdpA [Lachnospiraceae bacterium]
MSYTLLQDIFYIIVLVGLSLPLGFYINKIMSGQRVFLSRIFEPVEKRIYKLIGTTQQQEMTAKQYSISVIVFSGIGLVFLFGLLVLQGILPLNPEGVGAMNWDLAFNTAVSFITNTNWQAYSGESTLSYLSQFLGLTVQNFVSAATGIAVVFALIRGLVIKQKTTIGNFWVDITRCILYVLLPLSFIVAVLLVSQGVVQTFSSYNEVTALESGVAQTIPLGPAASQIAIKQLGTNGGGFFGANSAFPLENPTAFSNFVQVLSILLIPAALCVSFGKAVKDRKQGRAIYIVMLVFFVVGLSIATFSEYFLGAEYTNVEIAGSMEGKEIIHGVGGSTLWATATTAASNGSVNAMHDSLTPVAGMITLFLMQLGEIIFGGVGSGLYGMLAFVLLTVFIAGLMVGRTPEYLGKKVTPFDMKMVCIMILAPPLLTLLGTAAAVLTAEVNTWLTNSGAHGFSEVLYAFSSMANNNGSAFAGFSADTLFTNVLGGIIMLLVRFIPMIATIFLAGNMAQKKAVAASEGTLSTSNTIFIGLLIGVILIIGALSFLPALALGPIADFVSTR